MYTTIGTYFFLDDCLLSRLDNVLRISCATSWFFFTRLYQDARSAKHKRKNACFTYNIGKSEMHTTLSYESFKDRMD